MLSKKKYVINSTKSKLVNHKLKMQERQRNMLESTRAACYRSKSPLDEDFLSLIFLFFLPNFSNGVGLNFGEEKERKRRKEEEKMVGCQVLAIKVIFDQDLFSILIFHFTKIPFIFFPCWPSSVEKKERRKLQNLP